MVIPMKLAVAAQDQPCCFQTGGIFVAGKEHMPGRELLAARVLDRRLDQDAAHGRSVDVGRDEKTRTANRSERHGGQQFRVVGQAVLRIGVGPGKIEDEFAARVRLAVQGHAALDFSFRILDHQVPRRPAGARYGAARLLERQEKFMAQEGLAFPQKRVPTGRIDLCDAVQKSRAAMSHACRTRGSTRGSASARSKYLSASSAAMQPVPAEVTACR